MGSQKRFVAALNATNGDIFYDQRPDGLLDAIMTSFTLIGDVIFYGSGEGKSIFIAPSREYRELKRNQLRPFFSTPICSGDVAYLRTHDELIASRGIP